jgi:hypothetical protein
MKTYSLLLPALISLVASTSSFGETRIGEIAFGTQCPYGAISSPIKVPLVFIPTRQESENLKLSRPLGPLYLSADCKNKVIHLMSSSLNLVSSFEAMPDGSFSFNLPWFDATFHTGSGASCTTRMTPSFWGQMECENRDEPIIKIETVWWLNQGQQSLNGGCDFSKGAYLYASSELQQCR